jgi:hypothetical protein
MTYDQSPLGGRDGGRYSEVDGVIGSAEEFLSLPPPDRSPKRSDVRGSDEPVAGRAIQSVREPLASSQ